MLISTKLYVKKKTESGWITKTNNYTLTNYSNLDIPQFWSVINIWQLAWQWAWLCHEEETVWQRTASCLSLRVRNMVWHYTWRHSKIRLLTSLYQDLSGVGYFFLWIAIIHWIQMGLRTPSSFNPYYYKKFIYLNYLCYNILC